MVFSEAALETSVQTGEQSPFSDGKDPQALRTIGEVASALDIRTHVLRYWEEQFPALKPIKRSGNRRYYRPEDVALIVEINRLVHREGYTLKGAAKAIQDRPALPAPSGTEASAPTAEAMTGPGPIEPWIFDQLAVIRRELAEALERA